MVGLTGEEILVGYGPLGIFVALLLVFAQQTIQRLIKDRDQERDKREALVNDILTKVIPLIERNTQVLNARTTLDNETLDVLKDVRRLLERQS